MLQGNLLRDAIISAAITVSNKKQEIDELNVYPVPDGDTGTNMSMTMTAAARELELLDESATADTVSQTAASALLRGARGNSGVILSLIFRGIAKGFSGVKEASAKDIANALQLGSSAAYKAVMNPTEGTILTVIRMGANKAMKLCETIEDTTELWSLVCDEMDKTLQKTPEMLPTLKKAGVVDAGGMGLTTIFKAMLNVFSGGKVQKKVEPHGVVSSTPSINTAVGDAQEEIHFTYCTEYIVLKNDDNRDSSNLRAYLETIGDCVVVVDDREIIKVHVHSDHPGNAIEKGIEYGMLTNLKVENMRQQHENRVKENKIRKQNEEFKPAKPEKKYGFVAVACGNGIEACFKDLGADAVVSGGQTMNPSTDDILKAVYRTPAEIVFILPNNKNIIMAAEQVEKLVDKKVCVLQTRTVPQGIAAMMAFDDSLDIVQNRINMTKAFEKVSTGLVTFAARDSEADGLSIKKGDILSLENGRLLFTSKEVNKAAFKLVKKLVKSETRFVTIIYGADVTDDSAEKLQQLLEAKLSSKIEIMLIDGGQPVYYYMISAE